MAEVDVLFDLTQLDPDQRWTFTGDVVRRFGRDFVLINGQDQSIALTLFSNVGDVSSPVQPPAFDDPPVQWFVDDNWTKQPPAGFGAGRDPSNAGKALVTYAAGGTAVQGFKAVVVYDGTTYQSTDPTILNDNP